MNDRTTINTSNPADDTTTTSDPVGSGPPSRSRLKAGGAVGLGLAAALLVGLVVFDGDGNDQRDEPTAAAGDALFGDHFDLEGSVAEGAPPWDRDADETVELDFGVEQVAELARRRGDDLPVVDPADDLLVVDPADDLLDPGDGYDDDILLPDEPAETGLRTLCADTGHSTPPGMEGRAKSGVWVDGTVYGFPEGSWIWIQGSSLDNGEGQKIPVIDGSFSAPLGINVIGDHPIDQFQLVHSDPAVPPVDLLPAAQDAFGGAFTVGTEEGPIFDGGCLDFDPIPSTLGEAPGGPAGDDGFPNTVSFFDSWADAHRRGDSEALFSTLDPIASQVFGEETCREYVIATTGSITGAEVLAVEPAGPWDFQTPTGPIGLPNVISVDVEFTTSTGEVIAADGHLPVAEDGTITWLTTCGVDVP